MSKQMNVLRKRMVITSLVATVLLFAGVGLFWFHSRGGSDQLMWVILATGVLGIVAFLVVLVKNLRIDQHVAQLNEEYELVYEQLAQYVGMSGLSYFEKKELTGEILSLFLEAQEAGQNVNEVIGEDHQEFVDGMIQAYGGQVSLLVDLLTGVQYFIFYMVSGQALYYLKIAQHEPIRYFDAPMDYTLILFFALSAFGVVPMIARGKRKSLMISQPGHGNSGIGRMLIPAVLLLGGFIGTMEILHRFFSGLPWVAAFLENDVVVISSVPALVVAILGVVGVRFLKKELRKS